MPTTLLLPSLPPPPFLLSIDLRPLPFPLLHPHPFTALTHIPPGWHFVYSSPTPSSSLRSGFWFRVLEEEEDEDDDELVVVWAWDKEREELIRMRGGGGGGYEAEWKRGGGKGVEYKDVVGLDEDREREREMGETGWAALTSHLSRALLSRLTRDTFTLSTTSTSAQDTEIIPGLPTSPTTPELVFLGIDLSQTWREGAVGRERTQGARDRGWALGEMVRKCRQPVMGKKEEEEDKEGEEAEDEDSDGDKEAKEEENEKNWGHQILGSLETAFLMSLSISLSNWAFSEEWRRITTLLLTCHAITTSHSAFFIEALRILGRQLRYLAHSEDDGEEEMFRVREGWLERLLRGFARGLVEGEGGEEVRREMQGLADWVEREWGWDIVSKGRRVRRGMVCLEDGEMVEVEMGGEGGEEEEGEYAPVVVEIGGGEGDGAK